MLGVGGAVTLAAWSDSVFVNGDFETGSFNVQGSVNAGTSWFEFDTAPGGTLAFPAGALNITPGDTVYAAVSLRVDPTRNDYDATIGLEGATLTNGSGTLGTNLRYAAKTGVTAANCTSASFAGTGTTLVAANTALSTGSGVTTFELEDDSTAVPVCFAVTLPSNAPSTAQGDTSVAVWKFAASSTDPD